MCAELSKSCFKKANEKLQFDILIGEMFDLVLISIVPYLFLLFLFGFFGDVLFHRRLKILFLLLLR